MLQYKDICILIDDSILNVHHGVRRYLFALSAVLNRGNNKVTFIEVSPENNQKEICFNDRSLLDNGFSKNILIGRSRRQILKQVKSGRLDRLVRTKVVQNMATKVLAKRGGPFDLCIVGAPWIVMPNEFRPPNARRTVCMAYDAIPNLYSLRSPRDDGLRKFAHQHNRGYCWADSVGDGILCISEATATQCQQFGFGSRKGITVIPPMLPAGFRSIEVSRVASTRSRVAILAAPFDRRKGLLDAPDLVNAGNFDKLLVFGRARCTHSDLVGFFERTELDSIEWWCDVDFQKQVDLYAEAKVLIFPSTHEGLGFPVLEAYACGTSVLAQNIKPLNDLLLSDDLFQNSSSWTEQVAKRADEITDPSVYRSFVESLCSESQILTVLDKLI